ncbi:hypothetical protein [Actinopolymorpha sp. B9G3]|uniref:hypothetical protein n=1 Tax=Actinopolymorpha sp. B9G3 TaxID=3158970 RepID=UPI0032D8BC64
MCVSRGTSVRGGVDRDLIRLAGGGACGRDADDARFARGERHKAHCAAGRCVRRQRRAGEERLVIGMREHTEHSGLPPARQRNSSSPGRLWSRRHASAASGMAATSGLVVMKLSPALP